MGKIVALQAEFIDYDLIVDEIEVIVPKYLTSMNALDEVRLFDAIPQLVHNMCVYWERLAVLFGQIHDYDHGIDFQEIERNSQNSELAVLEKIYLNINNVIAFDEKNWSVAMWESAEAVLERMERVLSELGIHESHEDRLLIQEMIHGNRAKRKIWEIRTALAS